MRGRPERLTRRRDRAVCWPSSTTTTPGGRPPRRCVEALEDADAVRVARPALPARRPIRTTPSGPTHPGRPAVRQRRLERHRSPLGDDDPVPQHRRSGSSRRTYSSCVRRCRRRGASGGDPRGHCRLPVQPRVALLRATRSSRRMAPPSFEATPKVDTWRAKVGQPAASGCATKWSSRHGRGGRGGWVRRWS